MIERILIDAGKGVAGWALLITIGLVLIWPFLLVAGRRRPRPDEKPRTNPGTDLGYGCTIEPGITVGQADAEEGRHARPR